MRQADTTQETPGGNRGIAIALTRRPPADAACDSCRGVRGTTSPLVSTRGLHGQDARVPQTPPEKPPVETGGSRMGRRRVCLVVVMSVREYGISSATCPLVSTRGLHGREALATQTPPRKPPVETGGSITLGKQRDGTGTNA